MRTALVAVAVLCSVSTLRAQTPEDRAALEALRDSLASVTDTTGLLGLERSWIHAARTDRDNALLHLRLGFLALRLGELHDQDHYDDAASEFEWAIELAPEWPYPWYGLGLAERGLARNPGNVLFGVFAWLDRDQRTVAVDNFSQAASTDPSFLPALESLAEATEEQEINQRPQVALAAFRRGLETAAADEALFHLYLGRLERAFGTANRSLTAFDRYQALGGTPGLANLERARTEFLIDSLDGSASYYAGAASDDSATVAGYRMDLSPIASKSDLEAFDAASGTARVGFLCSYWISRDDQALQARGARLREHYRRLAAARKAFPRSPFQRRYYFGEYYRDNDTDFDDRGVIFVRHGPPTMRRPLIAPSSEAYGAEGWRYANADETRDFYFLATEDPQDYRLRATPLDLPLGNRTDFIQEFEPRLATAGGATRSRYAQAIFIQGKENIAVGTTTDSYELRFEEDVEAIAQIVTAGASEDSNVVHVALAISVATLVPADSGGQTYPITIRATATDGTGRLVARIDTTSVRRIEAADSVRYLLERISMPVPAGTMEVRVAVINGQAGGVFPRDTIEVLSGAASAAAMGAPVLGLRQSALAWPIPATQDSLFFNPLESFERGAELEVFYEVYGLTPGREYETRLEVKRQGGGLLRGIFGGGGNRISLTFPQVARGRVTRVRRTIGLEDLRRGDYTLTLTLTGTDGLSLVQERRFEVTD
jgi:tetratricopeptide (TPR) repeat protein